LQGLPVGFIALDWPALMKVLALINMHSFKKFSFCLDRAALRKQLSIFLVCVGGVILRAPLSFECIKS
jgi:hypothetical protein